MRTRLHFSKRFRKNFLITFFLFSFAYFFAKILFSSSNESESFQFKNNNKISQFNSEKLQRRNQFHFGEINSKEFRIILKDINISYYYYGSGIHSCGLNKLLIATMSRPNAKELRMSVRNSWKKDIPPKFTHKFFIGSVKNETLKNILKEESQKFGDIVFMSFIDSYLNLTLKITSIYQWQQYYCPKIEYFLRADEDTVLDVSRLQYWMKKEINVITKSLNNLAIFGHLNHGFPTYRIPNKKWYVPFEAYNETIYPDYINGASYLTTPKTIKMLLKEAKNHKHITVDDALYTGIIADKLGIARINSSKHFAYGNPISEWNPPIKWDQKECDENGEPFLLSIYDEVGEIETVPDGYNKALRKLKGLKCSESNANFFDFLKNLFHF